MILFTKEKISSLFSEPDFKLVFHKTRWQENTENECYFVDEYPAKNQERYIANDNSLKIQISKERNLELLIWKQKLSALYYGIGNVKEIKHFHYAVRSFGSFIVGIFQPQKCINNNNLYEEVRQFLLESYSRERKLLNNLYSEYIKLLSGDSTIFNWPNDRSVEKIKQFADQYIQLLIKNIRKTTKEIKALYKKQWCPENNDIDYQSVFLHPIKLIPDDGKEDDSNSFTYPLCKKNFKIILIPLNHEVSEKDRIISKYRTCYYHSTI